MVWYGVVAAVPVQHTALAPPFNTHCSLPVCNTGEGITVGHHTRASQRGHPKRASKEGITRGHHKKASKEGPRGITTPMQGSGQVRLHEFADTIDVEVHSLYGRDKPHRAAKVAECG